MGEWICDDRESPEEWDNRVRRYRSMSMEEIETMITYEEAVKIAKGYRPDVDHCAEDNNAYIFSCRADDGKVGPQPVVVMKDTGEVMLMPMYVASGKSRGSGDGIREFDIS